MLPSRVPLNDSVRPLLTAGEMRLTSVPSDLNSDISADTWKPAGQPSVVDQVGVWVAAPLAGLRIRLPGFEPVAAIANPAVRSAAPLIMPATPTSNTARRILPAVRHLNFASRAALGTPSMTGIAADATAQAVNSGRTAGEE